jgi:uncharacterized protein YeeX (DUF496 family)
MAENSRYFQWLVGERRGEVLVFDTISEEEGEVFIVFKDNSRINEKFVMNLNQTDATGKMMAEVENMSKLWGFKETIVGEDTNRTEVDWESQVRYDIPTVTEIASGGSKVPTKKKQVELIPPPRTREEVVKSRFGTIINAPAPPPPPAIPVVQTVAEQKIISNQNDPVWIMMSQSKKVDSEVELTLTISLPTKNLYNVAKESFEDGGNKVMEYIIENIEVSKIKDSLKAGIKAMYEDNVILSNYDSAIDDIPQ